MVSRVFMESRVLQPTISIVTASLNSCNHIERAIKSVASQDYEHIEHLVIDGGSGDGTIAILKQYESTVQWTSEPDAGQSDAINKGIRRSRGEIIGWLDSDNAYEPGAVREAVRILEENPDAGVVYAGVIDIDENGETVRRYMPPPDFTLESFLLYHEFNFIPPSSTFIRREALEKIGMDAVLNVDLHYTMDFDLWIRLGLVTKFARAERFWSRFQLRSTSKTGSQMAKFGWDILTVLDRLFARQDLPQELRENESRIRARLYEHAADRLITSDFENGRRLYTQAVREAPLAASSRLLRTTAYLHYRDSFLGRTYRGMKGMLSQH